MHAHTNVHRLTRVHMHAGYQIRIHDAAVHFVIFVDSCIGKRTNRNMYMVYNNIIMLQYAE